MTFLKGHARPTSPATIDRYGKTLLAFLRFLESSKEPAVLGSVTPLAVSRWVTDQREKRMSEEGIASRLSALKVFTKRYIQEHLEMTTWGRARGAAGHDGPCDYSDDQPLPGRREEGSSCQGDARYSPT